MRILLVEDDRTVAETLTEALGWYFVVDNAYSGSETLEMLFQHAYDLIILDYTLPDIQAPLLYEQIRSIDQTVKVLLVTGNDNVEDKIKMLDAGADDYVIKPFEIRELRARIRAVLRRGNQRPGSSLIVLDDLQVDVAGRTVRRRGIEIKLQRKDFDILEYLLRNQGRVVTREMILNHVWTNHKESSGNLVDVHIKKIRDQIDKPFQHPLIHTVPGVGYKIDT
ncbi:MAG TPA: response regulator transcription factor [Candidatus Saccharimonadia bacterium]|jgi:DNA-binding response OmpR family regulator